MNCLAAREFETLLCFVILSITKVSGPEVKVKISSAHPCDATFLLLPTAIPLIPLTFRQKTRRRPQLIYLKQA